MVLAIVPPIVVPVAIVVVIAAVSLPDYHRADAVPSADPAVVVAAVPVIDRDGTVAAAAPMLRRPVAMDSLDHHDPRALDHHHPARRGPPIGGIPVTDDDVTRDRSAPHHYTRLDPLSVEREGGSHETGEQRPGDGASHKTLGLETG
jgi:hypothetical protein